MNDQTIDINTSESILSIIKEVIREEANALLSIIDYIDISYFRAVELIHSSSGKVIVTGMGKSGLIARKIASTMSSTGTLAVFLHPAEAMHGDLGMVTANDVIVAIGKSGESEELVGIIPVIKKIGAKIIAITANPKSTLGSNADIALLAKADKEACPYDLAPTSSTTVALAVGDALAITLMKLKGFRPTDFALYHPGGKLGKRLLLKVIDLMIPIVQCPVLDPDEATMKDVILALSSYGLGIVLFSRNGESLDGILTDGDIRRILNNHGSRLFELRVDQVINPKPFTIEKHIMAVAALQYMEARDRPLNVLPVLDDDRLVGIIRLHELLKVS